MDFDLTAEQRRWQDVARDYAQGVIGPGRAQLDREQRFPTTSSPTWPAWA